MNDIAIKTNTPLSSRAQLQLTKLTVRAARHNANVDLAKTVLHDVLSNPYLAYVAAFLLIEAGQNIPTKHDSQGNVTDYLYGNAKATTLEAALAVVAVAQSAAFKDALSALGSLKTIGAIASAI